ncbi:MAG: lysine-2,3-aminomutase-like protein [Alphaproteobacteria bacterium]|nr:lysine-2,3-aminomutase-like protein [Alphaproteobacteria bacterium]
MTARTLRTVDDLAAAALIPRENTETLASVTARYALAITPAMAALIDTNDPTDPIARQFVPDARELDRSPQESPDPIGDKRHAPVEGIVHRYRDRVLLKIVHVCPVYCRFCFRREMVGPDREPNLSPQALDNALAYIAAHDEISEVILTGGDPFILTARRAADLTQRLAQIAHVKVLRWHTRVPVVDPERVTDAFVQALKAPGIATYVALHANHAREFTPEARAACARLIDAGIPMLSQSVLLKGVNDDAGTLADLMQTFVANRIKPYYLHHADLAPGTAHFRTTIAHGQNLMRDLRRRVGGLALPRYVLDIPGGHAKANLETCDVEQTPSGIKVRDDDGTWHDYLGS